MTDRYIDYLPLSDLANRRASGNPKKHDAQIIERSVSRFGFVEPIVLDERTGRLVAGHGRLDDIEYRSESGSAPPDGIRLGDPAFDPSGEWMVPVIRGWSSNSDDEAKAYLVVSNQATIAGGWDESALAALLGSLKTTDEVVFQASGFSDAGLDQLLASLAQSRGEDPPAPLPAGPSLADRFLVPPFSILDARQGYWQDRKRAWLSMGFRSEEGRAENLLNMSEQVTTGYKVHGGAYGSEISRDGDGNLAYETSVGLTSIFDPVLCEVAYRWWCPPEGRILDPFAGGSVRGIVAAKLGRHYTGIDLRAEQVEANAAQAAPLDLDGSIQWLVGNSIEVLTPGGEGHGLDSAEPFDFVFTCPPYFDLEQYSDDPDDLSNAKDYEEFLRSYGEIIDQAVARLADDRFACVVVGDIRDSEGLYRGFVADTITVFEDAGMSFYNEAILVTPGGSLALRAARIFNGGRKLGKSHQNVLVFVKGDWRKAAEACGEIDPVDVAELFGIVIEEPAGSPEPEDLQGPTPKTGNPGFPEDEPKWAKGYDVARLKEVAALFARHDGPLPLGAFSKATESNIAEWATTDKLRVWSFNDRPVAALVSSEARQVRSISDFRGRPIARIEPGDRVVSRLAIDAGHASVLVDILANLPISGRLFVEVWQEHPVARAIVEALGLEWLGTKVKASSELIGIFGPPPADPPSGLDAFGLVEFGLSYDLAALAQEIYRASIEWAEHYAIYNKGKTWSAVALRGYGGDPAFIIKPSEMSKKWKAEHPTEMAYEISDAPLFDKLPIARATVDAIPGVKHRVRLMRLAPGNGELSRHADITDPDAGIEPGKLLRLHIPVATNLDVRFRSWIPSGDEQVCHMAAGSCWYLDTRKPHTARNDGSTERIHLVVDVESSPELLALARDEAEIESSLLRFALPEPVGELVAWKL